MSISVGLYFGADHQAPRIGDDVGDNCELCRKDSAEYLYRKKRLCLDCKITLMDQDLDSYYERGE